MSFSATEQELTECDREAIHHIAAVQTFGGLIALNSDWYIAHRSANCAELLGLEKNPEPGEELAAIFQPRALEILRDGIGRVTQVDQVERLFGVRLSAGGELFDIALHSAGPKIIIEFEPHETDKYTEHLALIGPLISKLEPLRDVQTLCDNAAKLVREMLGHDRVMVYRFHSDSSGEVISEDKRSDLEPFLGLRYPRADIPQQARDLFQRNRFRIISDTKAEPVPIEPEVAVTGEPLDLSMSVLRAHSRMHMKYLVNMGVDASFSIAIVRQGKLWGLISGHHCSPRVPAFSLRTVAEMFSQMFSLMLDRILIDEADQVRKRGQALHDQLMVRLAGGASLSQNLPMLHELLKNVIPHDGSSVMVDGVYTSNGIAPSEKQFRSLLPALNSAAISTIISTHTLKDEIPAAKELQDVVGGALFLPISRAPRDFLVLWRKPLTRIVTWAGDPEKAKAAKGERLEPRGSFAAWRSEIEGTSEEWSEAELQIAESLRVTLLEVVLRMTDEVARERTRAQEQQELLISELNHRVRNILNLIRSLVNQSQHDASSIIDFSHIIGGRINALASAHDNITRENWAPAPLSALLKTELQAYLNEKRDRLMLNGEEVLIKPEAYTVLALVVHELVTNSAKYGSLCDSHGKLSIDLDHTTSGDLEIHWREQDGPPVKPPTRRGFGSTIIERSIPYELKGEADVRFKLTGLEAKFLIPAHFIARAEAQSDEYVTEEERKIAAAKAAQLAKLPKSVLLVEDSMIIALDTEESLKRLGVEHVAVASSVDGAMRELSKCRPDFAILDFNLGTESSAPVATALREAGVPFVLATGYGEMENQLDEIGADGLLRKPYGREDISHVLGVSEA